MKEGERSLKASSFSSFLKRLSHSISLFLVVGLMCESSKYFDCIRASRSSRCIAEQSEDLCRSTCDWIVSLLERVPELSKCS